MKVKALSIAPVVLAVSFAIALAVIAATYYMPTASAQELVEVEEEENEQPENEESEANEAESSDNEEASSAAYSYVAQPGDSYSEIARKAVQTYGLKNEVKLSQAQIIFAETNLTLQANSPSLTVGEEVSISEASVESWVEQAEDLSEEAEAAWAFYVSGVDFNTDNIGESR